VPVNLRRYLDVLRAPGVARLALCTFLGRLPYGIVGLSMILLMRREAYSYGEIGAVLAAESVAIALTAGLLGRLVDRIGQTRVILTCGCITSLALAADTASMLAAAPVPLVIALTTLYGAVIPPISASMRSLWGRLVPEHRVESAFAWDAVQLELVFIVGPLVAAGLATAVTPAAGLWLCAALYAISAIGYATAPAVRAAVPHDDVTRTRAGALASPGIRSIVLIAMVAAVSFGAIEVALPAFGEAEGSRAAAGPLIALWSLGSILGGLAYGSRTWRAPVERRMIVLIGLLALGTAPIVVAWSIPAMGALLVITGLALAPLGITQYALTDRLAPSGTTTEAYSWQAAATGVGFAVGSALAGVLVEHAGVRWALASGAIALTVGFFVAVVLRRTLRPETARA
jgi:MFS family permease